MIVRIMQITINIVYHITVEVANKWNRPLTRFSENAQSICFVFLADQICHICRDVREWQTLAVSAHAQKIGSGQRSRFLV